MSTILFSVFSGQASAIFDSFLFKVHDEYVAKKEKRSEQNPPNVYAIETQWDNGGHTGFLIDFYEWFESEPELQKDIWDGFQLPPPMGDLKSQISRWAKFLLPKEFANTISTLISNKHKDLDLTIEELKFLINSLQRISPSIFIDESKMNFLSTFINSYRDFVGKRDSESTHSVGNLFLSFLYFYSYLIRDNIDLVYDHHHQIFFNFLKDLSLVPRGSRFEFLIDGRYNLTGESFTGEVVPSERVFDEYVAKEAVNPLTYNLNPVGVDDLDNKFEQLVSQSDLVVIPPGSLSNWMPLLNKFHDLMLEKPIVWIINSFHHDSEVSLRQQIEYVQSLGIDPIILAPNVDSPFENLREIDRPYFLTKYHEERKQAEDFSLAFEGLEGVRIIRCIPLKELVVNEGGIKYNPRYIEIFLERLSCRLDKLVDISIENVYKQSLMLAEELNSEFSFIKVR